MAGAIVKKVVKPFSKIYEESLYTPVEQLLGAILQRSAIMTF